MKLIQLILPISLLFAISAACQETMSYNHCNCFDVIDVLKPAPSGKYTRTCNDVIVETGEFNSGLKVGEWNSFNLKGNLIKTINYSNGSLNGNFVYFYNDGKKKLSGNFKYGLKNAEWMFYNQKEKLQWSLNYKDGIPVGKSSVFDAKGKKVIISYDFDNNKYDLNSPNFSLFQEAAGVLQDPTSSEWFVLFLSDPTTKTKEMSLNQQNIESELLLSLIEIPSEFLNTYLNVNYNAKLTFEKNGLKSIELKREAAKGEEYPLFAFAAMTNDPEMLHRIEPSEFSLQLLDSKIEEALSIFTPWKITDGEFNMAFIYVINKIDGREEIDK